jgi:putative peptidoglycan lipid II flippase
LVFAAVDQPLIFAFYARKDTWTPALVGVVTVIMYVLLTLSLMFFTSLTLNGLILANSFKWAAHALIMLAFLRRNVGRLRGHGMRMLVVKATVASLVMGGIVHLVAENMGQIVPAGLMGEALLVGTSGLAGAVVYSTLAVFLRVEEIRLLGQSVRELGRRLTGRGR